MLSCLQKTDVLFDFCLQVPFLHPTFHCGITTFLNMHVLHQLRNISTLEQDVTLQNTTNKTDQQSLDCLICVLHISELFHEMQTLLADNLRRAM